MSDFLQEISANNLWINIGVLTLVLCFHAVFGMLILLIPAYRRWTDRKYYWAVVIWTLVWGVISIFLMASL